MNPQHLFYHKNIALNMSMKIKIYTNVLALCHLKENLEDLQRNKLTGAHVSTLPLESSNTTFKKRLKYGSFRVQKQN